MDKPFNQSQKTFNPIEIFRIDASILTEKLGKCCFDKNVLNEYFELPEKFTQGMLYFYFSHHIFDRNIEPAPDKSVVYRGYNATFYSLEYKKSPVVFPESKLNQFKVFLQQNYPNNSIFRYLYRYHFLYRKRFIIIVENTEGSIYWFRHDFGFEYNTGSAHNHFLEIFVRLFGEKVDHGYDPLGELVASGLESNGYFNAFLTRELYDPRILVLIHQFAFDPSKINRNGNIGEIDFEND